MFVCLSCFVDPRLWYVPSLVGSTESPYVIFMSAELLLASIKLWAASAGNVRQLKLRRIVRSAMAAHKTHVAN